MKSYKFLAAAALVCATPLFAATNYVSLSGSHTTPFDTWATAATNIQAAVDAASSGDTVLVTNGTYLLTADIALIRNINIQSVNGPDETIIDGQNSVRCFNLGVLGTIAGFTMTNGFTTNSGGAVFCTDATPLIINCVLAGNTAGEYGGGNNWGTLKHCVITGNTGQWGTIRVN